MIYPKNSPNQTCGYWLITPNEQTLFIETDNLLAAGNYKSATRQLQNNSVNGTMLITINRAIKQVIYVVTFTFLFIAGGLDKLKIPLITLVKLILARGLKLRF